MIINVRFFSRPYIVILLILFAGLNTKAQISLATPVDSTLHIGLNSYVQPVSLTSATTILQQDYRHYLRTAKTLKVLGWTSLGVGILSGYLGLAAHVTSTDTGEKADWLFVASGTLIAASIPLFIVSHHYKKKAVSLSLGSQQFFIPQGNRFVSSVQPEVSVKVSL